MVVCAMNFIKSGGDGQKELVVQRMSTAEVRSLLITNLEFFQRRLVENRLEDLRLMQDRRAIDNMNFCEVKVYIDAR